MTTQTLTALRQLKLGGMANALQSQLEQIGTYEGWPLPSASRCWSIANSSNAITAA